MAKTKEISAAEEEREPFPRDWSDIRGHAEIIRCLRRLAADGHLPHALIFTGAAGIGKRRTARVLARTLLCAAEGNAPCGRCDDCRTTAAGVHPDYFEVMPEARGKGAAMIRADAVRDILIAASESPQRAGRRIILIDGVHSMNEVAANRLLKTLEEPPARVIFILATTEPHKVPATIQSRCQRYDFHRITVTEIRDRLLHVCRESGIAAEADALGIIAVQADGGMRDALSILDQCTALAEGLLTTERVQEALGLVGHAWIEKMAMQIADCDAPALIAQLGELLQNGRELKQVLGELAQYFRSLMIVGVGGRIGAAELYAEQETALRAAANRFTQEEIMTVLRMLNETMQEIRTSPQPRIAVESMLIGLCRPADASPAGALLTESNPADAARIARLEAEVRRLAEQIAAHGASEAGAVAGQKAGAQGAPASARQTTPKAAPPKRIAKRADASTPSESRQLDAALWKSFQARLKERHRLAASLLSGADYEGATETHFFIRPATDMARDYIANRHRAVFEEVMSELAGRPLVIVCTGGEEENVPPPPAVAKVPEYPAPVAELLKIAGEGARVEEVSAPAKKPAPAPVEDETYEVYEPTPDEEAEMFESDELPPDENT